MNPSRPTRILVVEDELIIAADIASRLSRLGYIVAGQADRTEDAVRLAGELQPDLVLMDIRLQGSSDGVTAAEEIRRQFKLPVVYLTAHADEATLQRAKVTEPFGYVLKPFEERELRTVIEMAGYKHAAERRLAESERRYATTLSSIGDAVIATDKTGRVTFLNPVAEKLTGWTSAEAAGRPLTDIFCIVNEYTRATVENPVEKVLQTGTVVGLANHTILVSRDGKEFLIDDCASPILDDAGQLTGIVLVFRDVTEERRREEELRQAQKMEAVGRLASGVAHDFNNLLTVITGYCSLLMQMADPHSPWYQPLSEVDRAGRRAADLTRQLLAFGRKELVQPRILDLNQVVSHSFGMLQRLIPENVEVAVELHPDPTTIKADPGQIEQVIVNLVLNARDAMPMGGKLRLATTCGVYPSGQISVSTGNSYAALIVSDNGVGMGAETKDHLFEPFFTTKEVGKGTGLGLATVYGIVKQSEGTIEVNTAPGRGTTFTIKFPAVSENPTSTIAKLPQSDFLGGTETVLLVDDHEAIRGLAARVLRSIGYTVLEARHGIEALEITARYSGPIHLLVSDVIMPQMSGRTLADIVISQIPGVRVLFMTGYCESSLFPGAEPQQTFNVLSKPFTMKELTDMVRQVLDS